jgi:aryl-alcohol dehydrogenase-like predicted oxidoreductase
LSVIVREKSFYKTLFAPYAWQLAKAQYTAEKHGWSKFVSMQNLYNLIYREEEREMLPLCGTKRSL